METNSPADKKARSGLRTRTISALILAPPILMVCWFGGIPFVILISIAALIIFYEWHRMTGKSPIWAGAGLLYAFLAAISLIFLRLEATFGLQALVWLLAVVWGTDIGAYFCGRTLGGPKLWPRVSPGKTWSGLLGGVMCGAAGGACTLWLSGLPLSFGALVFGGITAIVSQGGDLLESAIKRRFGVKDSSALIPGHGGLMDRLDGLIAAAVLCAGTGLVRSGGTWSRIAEGAIVW